MSDKNPTVSIVVPVYNAERFICETIQTVLDQTYTDWELILVDDKSTDCSLELIGPYQKKDSRIKLLRNKNNLYAGPTRNKGVQAARGQFITFLDADDFWDSSKLTKQLEFMTTHSCAFSFTGYEFADENGNPTGKRVNVPLTITYKQAMKNTTIFTSTVMFDMSQITKYDIEMPDIRSGQDMATWWNVLKKIDRAYGLNENLSYYRRSSGTLSSNKLKAVRRTWHLYRDYEGLSLPISTCNFFVYITNAIKRRV
jgi:teichuronic acid biosynthesis glycosyltransferase TuaG